MTTLMVTSVMSHNHTSLRTHETDPVLHEEGVVGLLKL